MTLCALRRGAARVVGYAVLGLVFAVANGQWPLYSSNQNTYLLHGIARAGFGHLQGDWLANTADPTPVFSLLVEVLFRLFPPWAFHVVHAALAGVYALSVAGIVDALFKRRTWLRHGGLAAFFVVLVLDSAWASRVGPQINHLGAASLTQHGVAHQFVLGPIFQPSAFGVFLLLSICAFLRGGPRRAAVYAAVAATFHPTYALSAVLLDVGYAWVVWRRGRDLRGALRVAATGALSLAPIAAFVAVTFHATSAAALQRSKALLVARLALHASPAKWISPAAWCQIGVVVLALALLRRTRLFRVLLVPAVVGAALTLWDVVWPSPSLALFFPWRVSAFLVPLACAVVVAGPLAFAMRRRPLLVGLALVCAAAPAVFDGAARLHGLAPERPPLYAWIRAHSAAGDVFVAPVQLDKFRLASGAAEVVDHKSHPYRDVEVLEWDKRLAAVRRFYKTGDCATLRGLARDYGATHVVLDAASFRFTCGWTQVYAERRYRVMRIAAAAPAVTGSEGRP